MKAIKIGSAVFVILILAFGFYFKSRIGKIEEKKETTIKVVADKKLLLTQENGEVIFIVPVKTKNVSIFQMDVSWRILSHKFVGDKNFHRLSINENDFMETISIIRKKGDAAGSCGNGCEIYIY